MSYVVFHNFAPAARANKTCHRHNKIFIDQEFH